MTRSGAEIALQLNAIPDKTVEGLNDSFINLIFD